MSEIGGSEANWVTRDGKVISVPDLDDDHLTNIFEMLRGKQQFNYAIFCEMVNRGLWDADLAVLARHEFRSVLRGGPTTINGTVIE